MHFFQNLRKKYYTDSPSIVPQSHDEKLSTSVSSSLAIEEQLDNETNAKLSSRVLHTMLEYGIPGLTVCIAKKGKVVWQSAFGYCDVENQLECDPEASMRIASISKSIFSATVVAPMVQSNDLELNSSIHKYLDTSEFPKQNFEGKDYDITIEQLLTHTSGIRAYSGEENSTLRPIGSKSSKKIYQDDSQFERNEFYQRKTYRDVLDALEPFKNGPLKSEPGKVNYSTYGYTLLSAVMQKALQTKHGSQEQIEDFWSKALKKDWKLENTRLDHDEVIIPRRARYYFRNAFNGGLMNAPYSDLSNKWAGGGLISTARDLTIFGQKLIDSYKGRIEHPLTADTVRSLWTARANSYGLGFRIENLNHKSDSLIAYHTGSAVGASSVLVIYPEPEVVVSILTNMSFVNLYPLGLYMARTVGA